MRKTSQGIPHRASIRRSDVPPTPPPQMHGIGGGEKKGSLWWLGWSNDLIAARQLLLSLLPLHKKACSPWSPTNLIILNLPPPSKYSIYLSLSSLSCSFGAFTLVWWELIHVHLGKNLLPKFISPRFLPTICLITIYKGNWVINRRQRPLLTYFYQFLNMGEE